MTWGKKPPNVHHLSHVLYSLKWILGQPIPLWSSMSSIQNLAGKLAAGMPSLSSQVKPPSYNLICLILDWSLSTLVSYSTNLVSSVVVTHIQSKILIWKFYLRYNFKLFFKIKFKMKILNLFLNDFNMIFISYNNNMYIVWKF